MFGFLSVCESASNEFLLAECLFAVFLLKNIRLLFCFRLVKYFCLITCLLGPG